MSNPSETQSLLLQKTKNRMANLFTPNQVLGRIRTIGCVAVEITQKCNLDCTLCYLSEHSQQVQDIPIEEVFKRLDAVVAHYGVGTDVQITGGDPTLRKHSELIKIVRYAHTIGLYPALFTNGIAASRELLSQLANAGLSDVAFHVDSTQRRKGYETEVELNQLRQEYIERARGLGLMVIFNTTVHRGNFAELPELLTFFKGNADVIGLTSFQLQAETGRGEWRARDIIITKQTVQKQLEKGAGKSLPWEALHVGHTDCHSYLPTLTINNNIYSIVDDAEFAGDFLKDFSSVSWNRRLSAFYNIKTFLFVMATKPRWWFRLLAYGFKRIRLMAKDLIQAGGRAHQLTIFVQNFMDANHLEQDRVDGCSFMVMTAEGPVSMCEHNASRDDFILKPIDVTHRDGSVKTYQPLKASKKPSNTSKHNENTKWLNAETIPTVQID